MLKFQFDRACLQRCEANAHVCGKVEEKERKKEQRAEHPQEQKGLCVCNADTGITNLNQTAVSTNT